MHPDTHSYKQYETLASQLVQKAARMLASMQGKQCIAVQKDAEDIATTADFSAEKLIISELKKQTPTFSIYSEEAGSNKIKSDWIWYIDPLDGTKEFVRGLTEYNCLVSLAYKGATVAGAIQRNGTNELYRCSAGNGAYLNEKCIHVSQTNTLDHSFVGFHIPCVSNRKEDIEKRLSILRSLVYATYRVRPGWDDAKYFGLVARGVLDAHVLPADLNMWHDVAGGMLLVEEAGGTVTDWQGKPIKNHDMSHGILASNGKIHNALLAIIKEAL